MTKGKNNIKLTSAQRQTRAYRIFIIIISVIVLLTMVLSLIK
jgi:hypothetical protein